MKTTRTRRLSLTATCVLLATVNSVRAADENLRPIAFQNGVNQQTLSTETAELARQITALIEELQRNGFPIQSLNGLTELAAQLNSLGGNEMAGIAARLRKLGESASTDPRATATEAYLAQQSIESRLKNLARQISIQQLREETARRLEALINRQLAIQRETRAIATKPEAERQRILESDQAAIGEDLTTFFQTGENLLARLREGETPAPAAAAPATPPATPPAAPAKPGATAAPAPARPGAPAAIAPAAPAAPATGPTFTERINGPYLTTLSTEATDFIKGKRYPDAYARQESLIAELRKILQSILSSLPKEQRLASALQQVSALRQQEEANQQAKTPPTPEAKQAAADQAQNLASQTAQISPEASAALRDAQKKLQEDKKSDQASNQKQDKPDAQKQDGKQDGKQDPKGQPQPQPNAPQTAQDAQKPDGQKQDAEKQDGQKQDGQQTAQTPQAGQEKADQQADKKDQQTGQSEAGKALAAAEDALRKELAQVQQQQNGQQTAGQKQDGQKQDGQQTAQNGQPKPGEGQPKPGEGQQPGQQQAQAGQGQPKPGEGQQQQPQTGQGQAQQTAQNGQPDPNAQPKDGTGEGLGDGQNQIAGHGNTNGDPAQVLGALKREEREAFSALQNERYPAEYSAWVQQYWRNLAQDQ